MIDVIAVLSFWAKTIVIELTRLGHERWVQSLVIKHLYSIHVLTGCQLPGAADVAAQRSAGW